MLSKEVYSETDGLTFSLVKQLQEVRVNAFICRTTAMLLVTEAVGI